MIYINKKYINTALNDILNCFLNAGTCQHKINIKLLKNYIKINDF